MALPNTGTVTCLNTDNKSNHFYPNDGKIDQLLRKISFEAMVMSTNSYDFARATSIPTVQFFARDATLDNDATNVTCSSDTFERIGDHTPMDMMDNSSSRGSYDEPEFSQIEQQVRGIKLGILRQISSKLINGTASPDPIGFTQQVTAGHGVSLAASTPLVLQDLYKTALLCRGTDDFIGGYGGRYWVSNEEALRQVLYLLDQAGRSAEFIYDAALNTYLPLIFGLPWLVTDAVATTAGSPDTTDIFVIQLEGTTAVRLLYGKDKNHECDSFGIHQFNIPLQATKNNFYRSVAGFYAVHVPEDEVIVRLTGVQLNNIV